MKTAGFLKRENKNLIIKKIIFFFIFHFRSIHITDENLFNLSIVQSNSLRLSCFSINCDMEMWNEKREK